jgi:hypothetical protein
MRTLFYLPCFYLFAFCFAASPTNITAQKPAKKEKQAPEVAKFVKTATGIYDSQKSIIRAGIDTIANPMLRRQQIVCYPIWQKDSEADAWLYFGWFSPIDKNNALEEVFLHIYKQDDNLMAEWFEIPEQEKEKANQEWLKSEPFAKMMPFNLTENREKYLFATCDLKANKNGFMMKARERGEFKMATPAAYTYMLIEMGFYPNGYTSGSKFMAANGQTIIISHEHKFLLDKVTKKYQKF